jgi:hypothetical protein
VKLLDEIAPISSIGNCWAKSINVRSNFCNLSQGSQNLVIEPWLIQKLTLTDNMNLTYGVTEGIFMDEVNPDNMKPTENIEFNKRMELFATAENATSTKKVPLSGNVYNLMQQFCFDLPSKVALQITFTKAKDYLLLNCPKTVDHTKFNYILWLSSFELIVKRVQINPIVYKQYLDIHLKHKASWLFNRFEIHSMHIPNGLSIFESGELFISKGKILQILIKIFLNGFLK